jgi:hypothetical protein
MQMQWTYRMVTAVEIKMNDYLQCRREQHYNTSVAYPYDEWLHLMRLAPTWQGSLILTELDVIDDNDDNENPEIWSRNQELASLKGGGSVKGSTWLIPS